DDTHTFRRYAQPLDERFLHVAADGDYEVAPPSGGVVHEPPVHALRGREELGQDLMLQVEDGRHGRRLIEPWEHDGERKMDRSEVARTELATQSVGAEMRMQHRRGAPDGVPTSPIGANGQPG